MASELVELLVVELLVGESGLMLGARTRDELLLRERLTPPLVSVIPENVNYSINYCYY